MENWITKATELFHKYRREANNSDVDSLSLINAGKAVALSELLEIFGHKPEI